MKKINIKYRQCERNIEILFLKFALDKNCSWANVTTKEHNENEKINKTQINEYLHVDIRVIAKEELGINFV